MVAQSDISADQEVRAVSKRNSENVMDKVLKVIGAIVAIWIVFSLVGAVFGFLVHAVLWIALIAGGVLAVGAIAGRNRKSISNRR